MGILGQIRELRRRETERERQSEEMSSRVIVLMETGARLARVAGEIESRKTPAKLSFLSGGEREEPSSDTFFSAEDRSIG